jgi:hypothetical protein
MLSYSKVLALIDRVSLNTPDGPKEVGDTHKLQYFHLQTRIVSRIHLREGGNFLCIVDLDIFETGVSSNGIVD